ncbi:MAG: hypothetical protein GXP35_11580 [Actinobacteria bacterium]|nr:hypothetical protein [Actinomycetota bacterium]
MVALVAAACSSGGGDNASVESTVEAPPAVGESLFAMASLDSTDVEPLDRVGVTGVDGSVSMVAAYPLGDDTWGSTRLLTDDDGLFFLAPPNVAEPVNGGEVEILLTDGEVLSSPLTLNVMPLSEYAGGFEQEIAALIEVVDEDAALYGSSWDELAGSALDELPKKLTALKVVQMLIDDGDGGGAVGSYASLDPEAAAIADALIVKIALTEPIELDLLDLPGDGLLSEGAEPDGFASQLAPAASQAGPAGFLSVAAAPAPGGADCIPFPFEPTVDVARLSDLMLKSKIGEIATDTNGLAGKYLVAAELAFGVSATLEALGSAGKSKIAATILQGVAARKMLYAMHAGLMPSFFSNINPELGETRHEEDREALGRWTKVWVTANSKGYSLDGDLVGALIDGAGGELIGNAGLRKGSLIELEAGAVTGEVKTAVNDVLGKTSVISFCPNTWRVDIAGDEWSWVRPIQALFTVDGAAMTFQNEKEVGTDALRFSPRPNRFGGAYIVGDVPISTEEIVVRTGQNILSVTQPGLPLPVTVDLRWAETKTLEWKTDKGEWADGLGNENDGPGTRVLTTPTDPDDYPFDIEIESTTKTGLRSKPGVPRRYDFVEVHLAPIIVLPNPGSVFVRKELPFTATDRDGNPVDMIWTATGGSIEGAGDGAAVYTAGSDVGTYEVTATLPDNPAVFVTVTVEVVEADCLVGQWRLREQDFLNQIAALGGVGTMTHVGGQYLITLEEDGSYVGQRAAWSFSMTLPEGTVEILIDSIEGGTWIVDAAGERLSVNETSSSATVSMTLGGFSVPNQQFNSPGFGGEGTYECSDDVMTTTFNEGGISVVSILDRIG